MKPNLKKVAIFDIDGTIFRSSLLIEITEELIKEGIFPEKARDIYNKAHGEWSDRKESYDKYIGAVIEAFMKNIKGVLYSDFERVAKKVIDSRHQRVYRYTRQLIKELKKPCLPSGRKEYFLLAISHSPTTVVQEFCRKWGFDKAYGRLHETNKAGKFTGKVLHENLISDKAKILKRAVERNGLTLKGSVGVGDSESDIAFLKLVARPICFNPNSKLYKHAVKAGWEVVVERKDVVYEMGK